MGTPQKSTKIKNAILTSVVSTLIIATIYFLLSVGINTYEIQKNYRSDRLKLEEKYDVTQHKIIELRGDYLDQININKNKFDSIFITFNRNTNEHRAISSELNRLTYVIQINDEKMKEDLEFIKNMNINELTTTSDIMIGHMY